MNDFTFDFYDDFALGGSGAFSEIEEIEDFEVVSGLSDKDLDFVFDLQRFDFGGGGTVVENSYQPTEYELALQKISASYASAVAPNALHLNDFAKELLGLAEEGLRSAQPMYENFRDAAITRQNNALDGLESLISRGDQQVILD